MLKCPTTLFMVYNASKGYAAKCETSFIKTATVVPILLLTQRVSSVSCLTDLDFNIRERKLEF